MSTWIAHRDKGGQVTLSDDSLSQEWDEGYDVLGFVPQAGVPAWVGLIIEQPILSPGQIHPTITSAYVTRFDAKPIDTSKGWRVIVSYRVGDPKALDLPPTQRPAVIDISTESVEVPNFKKANGDAWLNKAGDLIAGLTKKTNRVIFAVQKNVAAVPAWTFSYADAVNDDPVVIRGLTAPVGHLLLSDLRVANLTKEQVNGIDYLFYPISFTLTFDPRKWLTKAYNRGLYQKHATRGYVPCEDEEGEPVTEPAFLDSSGAQLPFPVNPASIVELEGQDHDELPFSELPLS